MDTVELLKLLLLKEMNMLYTSPANRIERLLDTNGDGSGTTEMITGTGMYYIAPPPGRIFSLNRINIYIEDGTGEKFSADKYGASAALTNGIRLLVNDANGTVKLFTQQPVKVIGHWDLLAGIDMSFTDFAAGSSDYASVRFTFTRGGGPIFLDGDKGEYLGMDIQDNLGGGGAALVSHLAQVQGMEFSVPGWAKKILMARL